MNERNEQKDAAASPRRPELGTVIQELRRRASMTQEQLADRLGVTFQAVSKWENNLSCPDMMLLPELADVFSVSIDELFGRSAPAPSAGTGEEASAIPEDREPDTPVYVTKVPWEDDDTLHAVLYVGQRLWQDMPFRPGADERRNVTVSLRDGPVRDIVSDFAVSCENSAVEGDVKAAGAVTCGDVGGDVQAAGTVSCGDVGGDVQAMGAVTCRTVGGDLRVSGSLECGDVEGDVKAGSSVRCGDVSGDVPATEVTASSVEGNVKCAVFRRPGRNA